MTFVLVGGGPTGVELAGALGEIAHDTLKRDFRAIRSGRTRGSSCVEAMDRVLPPYPPGPFGLGAAPARAARRRGPDEARGSSTSTSDGVRVTGPDGTEETIPTRTVLWAAGVQASSFARTVAEATGAETDRVRAGHRRARPDDPRPPGDLRRRRRGGAAVEAQTSRRPGVAQGAMQGGTYAAKVIRRRSSAGRTSRSATATTATSRSSGGCRASPTSAGSGPFGRQGGFPAWALWLGIHIFYLIGFSNRIVVLIRWAWTFLTHGRGDAAHHGQGRCCRRSRSPSRRSWRRWSPSDTHPAATTGRSRRARLGDRHRRGYPAAAGISIRNVVPSGPVRSTPIRPPFAAQELARDRQPEPEAARAAGRRIRRRAPCRRGRSARRRAAGPRARCPGPGR